MYGSIPGNAVVVNFLMRWPALIPVAAAVGIVIAVPTEVPVVNKTECVVLFDTDKSVILPTRLTSLKDCVGSVSLNSIKSVEINGYTDSRHTVNYNLGLSARRSATVKQAVVGMSVSVDKVKTAHHGKNANFGDNNTKEGRQQNRRVTVIIQ